MVKWDLKKTMQGTQQALMETVASCGDVNRNVMCHPNPVDSRVHEEVQLLGRLGFPLEPARAFTFGHNGDRLGWVQGHDGRWSFTLHLDAGRVADRPGATYLTGLREIARIQNGDFRRTPNRNLMVAGICAELRPRVEALLEAHALNAFRTASPLKRNALACVALPTCALAMAEAERTCPGSWPALKRAFRPTAWRSSASTCASPGVPTAALGRTSRRVQPDAGRGHRGSALKRAEPREPG